jgi:hypothetical protein
LLIVSRQQPLQHFDRTAARRRFVEEVVVAGGDVTAASVAHGWFSPLLKGSSEDGVALTQRAAEAIRHQPKA